MFASFLLISYMPLTRFVRACGFLRLQLTVKCTAKVRELCLALLGHEVHFGFILRQNSFLASIFGQIHCKISRALPRFAVSCGYFGFNLWSNSDQKFMSYVSLRSAIWSILASIPAKFILVSIFGQSQSKIRELFLTLLCQVVYFGFNFK